MHGNKSKQRHTRLNIKMGQIRGFKVTSGLDSLWSRKSDLLKFRDLT